VGGEGEIDINKYKYFVDKEFGALKVNS